MIRDAVKFIGLYSLSLTIGRCCLEYFDQLLVLAPVMEERIKKGIMMASVSLMPCW